MSIKQVSYGIGEYRRTENFHQHEKFTTHEQTEFTKILLEDFSLYRIDCNMTSLLLARDRSRPTWPRLKAKGSFYCCCVATVFVILAKLLKYVKKISATNDSLPAPGGDLDSA